jgi:hypothetical protein
MSFGRRPAGSTILVVLWIGCLLSAQTPSTEPIEEISLERGCFGCATPSIVTLRRDGTATLRTLAVLRHGTVETIRTSAVPTADFKRLAALIVSQRFLDLNDTYSDPTLADGSTTITTVVIGSRRKTVVNRNETGPKNLKIVENAIDLLSKELKWSNP